MENQNENQQSPEPQYPSEQSQFSKENESADGNQTFTTQTPLSNQGFPPNQQPFPLQPNFQQPIPGQQFPGQPMPGQSFPGQPYMGQSYPQGQASPIQPNPNQTYPGQPFSQGQSYPGQPIPGQQYPGQSIPGQPGYGQSYPGYYPPQPKNKTPYFIGLAIGAVLIIMGIVVAGVLLAGSNGNNSAANLGKLNPCSLAPSLEGKYPKSGNADLTQKLSQYTKNFSDKGISVKTCAFVQDMSDQDINNLDFSMLTTAVYSKKIDNNLNQEPIKKQTVNGLNIEEFKLDGGFSTMYLDVINNQVVVSGTNENDVETEAKFFAGQK